MTKEQLESETRSVGALVLEMIGDNTLDRIQEASIAMSYLLEAPEDEGSRYAARLAVRIHDEMPSVDEPRFSCYDYVDGIVHATYGEVDMDKLLALDDEEFAKSLVWLACYKRETYENRPHEQEPLEHDIWK